MAKFIEVKINKPLYSTFCNIRDVYINQAKKQKIPLKIVIPQGEAIYTADEWLKGAKRVEQIFLIKDCPMVLYGNTVKVGHTPTLKGKARKDAEAYEKYNNMSDEERFYKYH